jgi:hypothetical protein
MEYLSLIISFIVGGGLTTLINWKNSKRKEKIQTDIERVDFADKSMKYMEEFNDKLIKRIEALENEVKWLTAFKCEKNPCRNRVPPTPLEVKQEE